MFRWLKALLGGSDKPPTERVPSEVEASADAANLCFGGSSVVIRLDSPHVVFIDPLALDGLRDGFQTLPRGGHKSPRESLSPLLEGIRPNPPFACYEIPDFHPGDHEFSVAAICKLDEDEDDAEVEASLLRFFSVDSAAVLLVDFAHLPDAARLLTWERYDRGLQESQVFDELCHELGGAYFALVFGGGTGVDFDGDGVYCVGEDAFRLVAPQQAN